MSREDIGRLFELRDAVLEVEDGLDLAARRERDHTEEFQLSDRLGGCLYRLVHPKQAV